MISYTDFIPAYSEGFKFLEMTGGRKEVEKFWSYLSEIYLKDTLGELVTRDGLAGCYAYWSHSLNEEAADFTMILDEIKSEFIIDMHKFTLEVNMNTPLSTEDGYRSEAVVLGRSISNCFSNDYH